jgi:hypothetical protein
MTSLPETGIESMQAQPGATRNYWVTFRDPCFQWKVVFPYDQMSPEQLLWWVEAAIAILDSTGLYRVYGAPRLGYSCADANPRLLAKMLRSRYEELGELDLFFFSEQASAGNPASAYSTRIVYYQADGTMATEDCADLALIQEKTQPWLNQSEDYLQNRKAIVFDGSFFYPKEIDNKPTGGAVNKREKKVFIWVRTYTDIWQPKVAGFNEVDSDGTLKFPNEELARINGGRLNASLRRLKDITLQVGGEWAIDEDYLPVKEYDENGVKL